MAKQNFAKFGLYQQYQTLTDVPPGLPTTAKFYIIDENYALYQIAANGSPQPAGGDTNNKGWFADLTALQTSYPIGQDGWFAILGSTDTIWTWDSASNSWLDTDQKGQVQSVNTKTGDVVLGASDILTDGTFTTNTTELSTGVSIKENLQRSAGRINTKEPIITAGTTSQYYRGDKTFQTLNADVIPNTVNRQWLRESTNLTEKTIDIVSNLGVYEMRPATGDAFSGVKYSHLNDTLKTTIDNKLDKNATITGATKTKITYDAKGLVTSGVDATTTDIAEGANLYFTDIRAKTAAVEDVIADGVVDKAPSQNAVFDALALKADLASPNFTGIPSAPTATTGTSTTQIATTAFVSNQVSATIAALDVLVFKGIIDASTNPNYPAGDAGHLYRISIAGKIGGASGVNVEAGDQLLCLVDGSASGTQASVGTNWNITQVNTDGAVVSIESSTADNDFIVFSGTSGKVVKKVTLSAYKTLLALTNSDVGLGNVPNINATNLSNDTIQGTFTPSNTAIATGQDGKTAFQNAQGQINAKQNTITGAASTITTSNLTASIIVISDTNGKVGPSGVSSTQLSTLNAFRINNNTNVTNGLFDKIIVHLGSTTTFEFFQDPFFRFRLNAGVLEVTAVTSVKSISAIGMNTSGVTSGLPVTLNTSLTYGGYGSLTVGTFTPVSSVAISTDYDDHIDFSFQHNGGATKYKVTCRGGTSIVCEVERTRADLIATLTKITLAN